MPKENILQEFGESVAAELSHLGTEIDHLNENQKKMGEKMDKIIEILNGNGNEGLKTTVAMHNEWICSAKARGLLEEARLNTEFRNGVKSFVIKILAGAIVAGGGASALWQLIAGALKSG